MRYDLTLSGRGAAQITLELTPQRGPKIARILEEGFDPIVISIERCGVAQRQAVGRRNMA
jgi:hypothetical protein